MRYKRIRYLDRFILYDFIRNLIILYFLIPRSPNFKAHKLKKCQWKAILISPLVHSVYIKQSMHTKLHRYSADGDTSTTIILCRAHVGASGRYVPGTCGRIGSTGLNRLTQYSIFSIVSLLLAPFPLIHDHR